MSHIIHAHLHPLIDRAVKLNGVSQRGEICVSSMTEEMAESRL